MLLRFRSAPPLLRPRLLLRAEYAGTLPYHAPAVLLPVLISCMAPSARSVKISGTRTGTTAALWNKRFEMEQYKKGATKPQEVLVEKAPSASHMSIELPVCTDADIRDQYANFRGGIQFGKLLEDIDAFAGNIAFLHCDDGNPETKQHRLVSQDLCGVGSTKSAGKNFLQGSVVFVAVNDKNKAPPAPEASAGEAGARKEGGGGQVKEGVRGHVALGGTTLDAVRLMQPQQKNRAGKIFGGYLMNKAYELAFATASKFSVIQGGAPTVFAVDDVSFAKPVSIGDVITFSSSVVYTGTDELGGPQEAGAAPPANLNAVFQVRVGTSIVNLQKGTSTLSNEFHFTFFNRNLQQAPAQFPLQAVPVVGIVPHTYREGMVWIDGRRRMLEALEIQAEVGGVFAESIGYKRAGPP